MRVYSLILLGALWVSCNSRDREDRDTGRVDSLEKSDQATVSEESPEDTLIVEGAPAITTLPLRAHDSESGMSNLVKKAPVVYRLPVIEKLNYITIDSSQQITCDNGSSPSSALNFKRYRYRLPDVGIYKVYIVCDTTFADYRNDATTRRQCLSHMYRIHGYVVLYDSLNRQANVISVQYQGMDMHGSRRTFDVDKDYVIHLQDYELSSETEEAEEVPTLKYSVMVVANGEIEIERPLRTTVDEATGKILSRKPSTVTVIFPDGRLKKTVVID
jgi:hypothetical protein